MSRLGLLDKNWLQELKSGSPFFRDSASNGNTDLLRRVWERVRDEFLPQYIAEHPGERTFCWWCFDHKRERPIIGAEHFPEFDRSQNEKHGFLDTETYTVVDGHLTPLQEPKRDYLERLGLLTDAERSAMATLKN